MNSGLVTECSSVTEAGWCGTLAPEGRVCPPLKIELRSPDRQLHSPGYRSGGRLDGVQHPTDGAFNRAAVLQPAGVVGRIVMSEPRLRALLAEPSMDAGDHDCRADRLT